jgi:hypothetical protein
MKTKMNARTKGKNKKRQEKSKKSKASKANSRRAANLEQLIIASVQGLPLTENLTGDPGGVFGDPQILRGGNAAAERSKQKRD